MTKVLKMYKSKQLLSAITAYWCHLVSGHAAALRLGVPGKAVGEGATRAGGAGVPAYSAVAGHLAPGVTTTGDNGAGVQAFLTILKRI